MPLSYQVASDWYSTGGRYWRRVWAVAGYYKQGDKFLGPDSIAWAEPMSAADTAAFWDDLEALARASDEWQASQGQDVPAPQVDVNALVHRSSSWRDALFSRWSIWEGPPTTARKLLEVLKAAEKQLKEWYRRRFPGRPPLPPALPSVSVGGPLVALVVVGLALSSRRGRRRR